MTDNQYSGYSQSLVSLFLTLILLICLEKLMSITEVSCRERNQRDDCFRDKTTKTQTCNSRVRQREKCLIVIEQSPITTLTKTHRFQEKNAFYLTPVTQSITVFCILMDKRTSNAQARPMRVGCGSNPNNAGEMISIDSEHYYGGADVRELVALVGTGASGRGSSNQTAHGLAQANSVAANKRW